MTDKRRRNTNQIWDGHRIIFAVILCLFGLCVAQSKGPRKHKRAKTTDERIYLVHADVLKYDQFGSNPEAQMVKGHVSFKHKGARLTCDSANFYESSNSFEAFGHVRMYQGDTLSLFSDYAYYDGSDQMAEARKNVVLTHRGMKLYTDSLNYDRLYSMGWFFEGGKLVDKQNVLTSDWGEYHASTRDAVFNYNVHLKNPKYLLATDTLHYDTKTSVAHIVGPSTITSKESVTNTSFGYFDTRNDRMQLFGRSSVKDKEKDITGDSLYYDEKKGISEGFGNVIYIDAANKNKMVCDHFWYNEKTGYGYATQNAVMEDYSQKDTLWVHSDSMKVYTYNIETDSVYRVTHCFNKVRAYRADIQAVCDSLVYNSLDSCMTMYKDPIAWSGERQLLGEIIKVYMKDSTIERGHVTGQALSVEKVLNEDHYNQVASKEMFAFFEKGEIYKTEAVGNVQSVYFPIDEKDTTLLACNYLETDTMRMYLKERKLQRIWACKSTATWYPVSQAPIEKSVLPQFVWFDYIRPLNKDDIFVWRGKERGTELKVIPRHDAPLQHINLSDVGGAAPPEDNNIQVVTKEEEVPVEVDKANEEEVKEEDEILDEQTTEAVSP